MPENTVKTAKAMYKTLTRPADSVTTENTVCVESIPEDVNDAKLERMTVKVTKSFNAKEINVKVYMTRNFLSPSWKDLLKLYNNFFCSF